ncbi:MAG: hypothetical protein KME49_13640 [Brasilonema octagenarum HA4186-MV1]|jgi:metal-responsive CopG/Arc/MetJ family transcriptional regulator|nr:hypothetical protein [Brasilonema octagenarum HA4186-MV1]
MAHDTNDSEQMLKKIRVAGYCNDELRQQLDDWCKENNKNRNEGLRYIIRTMLNINDGSDESELQIAISMLEAQVTRLKSLAA